jgi:hypothetical protein
VLSREVFEIASPGGREVTGVVGEDGAILVHRNIERWHAARPAQLGATEVGVLVHRFGQTHLHLSSIQHHTCRCVQAGREVGSMHVVNMQAVVF